MADKDALIRNNPNRLLRCLEGLLAAAELEKIRDVVREAVRQHLRLAHAHLRLAQAARGRLSWRQRVSRGYYCCYVASRAARLYANGHYSTEPSDHAKIGELPTGFPDRDRWAGLLTKFRADRNLADYDHVASEKKLEYPSAKYVEEAARFLRDAKTFLRAEGAIK